MRPIASWLACSVAVVLSACGGGGSGGSTSPPPPPPPVVQPQAIAFATPGAVIRPWTDATYTNAASGGAGTGAITYLSSNTAVATVSATGVVTFVTAGAVTITANKAADPNYLAATASYSLTITAPVAAQPQTIAFATPSAVTRPLANGSYTNAASGGAGTGAISYQSSNTSVAAVSATGVATFIAAGSTTITANKAADANYLAASSSYSLTITAPVVAQPQTISFANAGAVTRSLIDASFTNTASGGAGTGAITYQSSNTAVATVAGTGVVTFVTAGSVTITANKAADTNYLAATASYTLTITSAAAITFTGWMGAQDTQITFSDGAANLEFLRSPQLDCNAATFVCTGGVASAANSTPADNVAYLGREVNWWLRRGASVSPPLRINPQRFSPRYSNPSVSWRGKIWMVGGGGIPSVNDVWTSEDGNAWTQVLATNAPANAPPYLYAAALAAFNDRLWLMGGQSGSVFSGVTWTNQVWSSGDGVTWRQEPNAAWPGRSHLTALVFNNRMWVIGGYPSPYGTGVGGNDAWSTVDGITWVEETHDAPFGVGARATVLNGRIYTVMGEQNEVDSDDVHSSADGRTWRLETGAMPVPHRDSGIFAALNGRLYLAGGVIVPIEDTRTNDVWSSADGVTWVQETPQAGFSPRDIAGSVVHNGRLWILGGKIGSFDYRIGDSRYLMAGDVWSTTHGSQWTEHSPHADGIWQGLHNALVHNGRMWLIGGWDNQPRNDTWSSTDGMNWARQPAGTSYPKRSNAAYALYNNEFWIAGGYVERISTPSTRLSDVWHSPDGVNWTRSTDNPAFAPRSGFQMVAFNNQLYVLGGYAPVGSSGDSLTSDVFSSTDGVTWNAVPQVAPFEQGADFKALVFNGRLYLIGVGGGNSGSDVWSTADGSTWRAEGTGTPRRGRMRGTAAVHHGKLWATGGGIQVPIPGVINTELGVTDALYSSVDGVTWTTVTGGPRYGGRAEASMLSFDNKLWVFGGSDAKRLLNDVWVSADDGVSWRMRYTGTIPYP